MIIHKAIPLNTNRFPGYGSHMEKFIPLDERDMPPLENCKICKNKLILLYRFSWGSISHCRYCGSEFLSPKEETQYDHDYYRSWFHNPNQKTEEIKRVNFKRLLSTHFTTLKGKKLLDIGCATGFLLQEAKLMGAEVSGIDINEWAVERAKKLLPYARVYCGNLNQAITDKFFNKDYFDVIVGTDVIEHIDDTKSFLTNVIELMKKGGKGLFTTPDLSAPSRLFLRRHWFQYKNEHLCFISKRALCILSDEIGFTLDKVVPVTKRLSLGYLLGVLSDRNRGIPAAIGGFGAYLVKTRFLSQIQLNFSTGEMLIIISKG